MLKWLKWKKKECHSRVQWFYLPGSDYNSHFHIYYEWVRTANDNGVPIQLLYITPYSRYKEFKQDFLSRSRLPNVRAVVLPNFKYGRMLTMYLRYVTWNSSTVIHARHFNIDALKGLRVRMNGRLRILYELEGDIVSEVEFLRENPNPYTSYEKIMTGNGYLDNQRSIVENCDMLSLVSNGFKAVVEKRYNGLIASDDIVVLPTGGKAYENHRLDKSIRNQIRKEYGFSDKYIVNYTGNVFYTWANFDRCLEAFLLIKKNIAVNSHFLAMVPEADHEIARKYFEDYSITPEEYTLIEVDSEKLKDMLLASDVGLLLRPEHISMLCGSPGKFCDYVSSGLPVLMNTYAGDYSGMVLRDGLFPLVQDIKSDSDILECVQVLYKYTWEQRLGIVEWAEKNIMTRVYADEYVSVLSKLATSTRSSLA
ncbi:MAG TPA: hypothetical protein DD473_25860 [Planctomycetaceae bacterium]|nr:hypothetical protein [Planctomycetaceae bacterium]